MQQKACKCCRQSKPMTEFYRSRNKPGGYMHKCRACYVAKVKSYNDAKKKIIQKADTSGLRLEDVPTMPRQAVIAWAADRYGNVRPSPDDILSARWPKYQDDREHVAGYHHDSIEVQRIVMANTVAEAPRCMVCDAPIPGDHNRRYCSTECLAQVTREHRARRTESLVSRLSDAERQHIVALRTTTDLTLIELAAQVRRSVDTVRRVLDAAGVRRGGSPRPKRSDSMSQSLGSI